MESLLDTINWHFYLKKKSLITNLLLQNTEYMVDIIHIRKS